MQWDDIPPVVNYLKVSAPGHPLASTRGEIGLHRWVLYRRLGPGPHPCHWCGMLVNWTPGHLLKTSLVVDHLDGNRGNNEGANLLVACRDCNAGRRRDSIRADESTVLLAGGQTRAGQNVCEECGSTYLTRRARVDIQRFCSRWCQVKAHARLRMVPPDEPHVVQVSAGVVKARLRATERTCETCGSVFLAELGRIRKGGARFCSASCTGKTVARGPRPASAGAKNHHAALTEEAVREMRRLWAAGGISLSALGARFGVSKSGANMVVYRRSWKHVT